MDDDSAFSSSSEDTSDYDNQLNDISTRIPLVEYYIIWPMVILSVLTNLANLYVYSRKSFNGQSLGVYLSIAALFDILQTYSNIYHYNKVLFKSFNDLPSFLNSRISCKLAIYLYHVFQLYPPWMSVVASLDRAIQIVYLSSVRYLAKKRYQFVIIFVTFTIASSTFVYLLIYYEYGTLRERTVTTRLPNSTIAFCSLDSEYLYAVPQLNYYLYIIMVSLLPFLLMTVFNSLTVVTLIRSKMKTIGSQRRIKMRKERTLALTLIGMNIVFFLSYIPFGVIGLTKTLLTYDPLRFNQLTMKKLELAESIAFWMRNLYSYFQFTGFLFLNRIFRKEIVAIIKKVAALFSPK